MSRVLAQLMGAAEPAFRAQLMRLERAAGLPGADIRLMMEVVNETRAKLRELGLDPRDTTGPELYAVLHTRLLRDEVQVRAALNIRADGTPLAVLEAVQAYIAGLKLPTQTFAVRQPAMRALLKKLQPKATMKRLGYRSLDSMIKHEPAALVLAAASIIESSEWQRRRLAAYRKLKVRDFETRKVSFLLPAAKRWPEIAAEYTTRVGHDILNVPELGAVVILPPEHDIPALAITTLLLGVDCLNGTGALGSYLKLQQVKPDFAGLFTQALLHEPLVAPGLGGEPLPWKVVQWLYGRGLVPPDVDAFEPYLQPEDLSWQSAESLLATLHPTLEFWRHSELLALLDTDGQVVSLNVLDVALSVCNGLEYADRIVRNMRLNLGRELLARYFSRGSLQSLLLGNLHGRPAPENALGI